MWADRLGCKNLLRVLSIKHSLKILLNKTRCSLFLALGNVDRFCEMKNAADILVSEEQSLDRPESFTVAFDEQNTITLRVITTERVVEPMGEVKKGLVFRIRKQHHSIDHGSLTLGWCH